MGIAVGGAGKGKSQLASMWSKAPPKTAKAQPAADAPPDKPSTASHASRAPGDAEEALRQAQEASQSACHLNWWMMVQDPSSENACLDACPDEAKNQLS